MPENPIKPDSAYLDAVKQENKSSLSNYITPAKKEGSLDAYKPYFGEGQIYTNEGLDDARALNQEFMERRTRNLTRGLATFGTSMAETVAGIASLAASPFTYDKERGFVDSTFNNDLMKGIEEIHKDILDNQALYYTEDELKDESITGWLSSGQFADDLTQGAAFLAAQFIPANLVGKLTKSATFLSKVGKAGKVMDEAGVVSKLLEKKTLAQLANLTEAEWSAMAAEGVDIAALQKTIGNTQRVVNKIGEGTAATIGRLGESTMERNQTYNDLIAKGVDEETARKQADNVFWGNMALAALDAKQYSQMFGAFGRNAKKGLVNEMYDDATKLLFKEGDSLVARQMTKADKTMNYLWGIGKQMGLEGYEELQQYSFQEAAKKLAMKANDPNYTDGIFDFLGEAFQGLPESLTTVEGQRAAILGGLLGGGVTAATTRNQQGEIQKAANSISAGFNENAVYQKDKVDPTKRFLKDDKGNQVVNNTYLSGLNRFTELEERKIIAATNKDFIEWDRLNNLQLFGQVDSFKEADMLDELRSKYQAMGELTTEQLASQLETTPDKIEDPKVTSQKMLQKIDSYNDLLDSITTDPTLSALNKKAQRNAAVKIFNFEENKNQINKINGRLAELDMKNIEYVNSMNFDSETDEQQLGNREAKTKSLAGLHPADKIEYEKLQSKKEALLSENEDVTRWFTEVRKPENLKKFNEGVDEFKGLNKSELVDKSKKTTIAKETEPKVLAFYKRNTTEDEQGFESSDIEIVNQDGAAMKLGFAKDEPNQLKDLSTGQNVFSTEFFLENSSTNENGETIITAPNGVVWKVNITNPIEKRTIRQNKAELIKLQARITSLEAIRKNLLSKKETKANQNKNEIAKLNDELAEIVKQLENKIDKRTKVYKELIAKREQIQETILQLEIELEQFYNDRPNLVARGIEIKTELDTLKEQYAQISANLKVAAKVIEKEKLENKVKELEGAIAIEKEITDAFEQTIADKKSYLNNMYKVLDALDKLLLSRFNKIYDKYPEVVHKILQRYGVPDTANLIIWFKDFKRNKTLGVVSKREADKSQDFKNAMEEVLTSIEDVEIDKYNNEVADLEKELAEIEQAYAQHLKETGTSTAKLEFQLNLVKQELTLYNKTINKLTGVEPAPESKNSQEVETSTDTTVPKNGKKVDLTRNGAFVTAGNDGNKVDELNPNEEERRWYAFLENKASKVKGLRLMTVTINDPVYGLNAPKSIYTEPIVEGTTHNIDDIRFIAVDEHGTPQVYGDKIITGRMRTDNTQFVSGDNAGQERYFSTDESIPFEEQLATALNKLNKVREQIKNTPEENYFFPVLSVNKGTIRGLGNPTNVVGTLINSDAEIKDLTISVSMGNVMKGIYQTIYPKGRVLITHDGNLTPAITRTIDRDTEGRTVLELTKKWLANIKNGVAEPRVLGKDFAHHIPTFIRGIVYESAGSDKPFKINEDVGTVIVGDQIISTDELLSGKMDDYILDFLATKPIQVYNKNLNTNKPYRTVEFVKDGFRQMVSPSYNHYLVMGTNPILKVTVKPILPNATENQQINDVDFRRYQNGYITYDPVLNTNKKVVKVTKESAKTEGADDVISNLLGMASKTKAAKLTIENKQLIPADTTNVTKEVIQTIEEQKTDSALDRIAKLKKFAPKSNVNALEEVKARAEANKKGKELNRLSSSNKVIVINVEEAKQNLAAILDVPVEIVNGKLIDGIADGQLTQDGTILLSDLAEEGTEYHEAFHRVSQFLLTSEERKELYTEYRKIHSEQLTDLEVEERLAEDFRLHALKVNEQKGKVKSLFDRIINFFINLFTATKDNSTLINNLYTSIMMGNFKDSPVLVDAMDYSKLNSNTTDKARVFNAFFSEIVDANPELYFELTKDYENDEKHNLINAVYNEALNSMLAAFYEDIDRDNVDYDLIPTEDLNTILDIVDAHKKYIKNIGVLAAETLDIEDMLDGITEEEDSEAKDTGKGDSEDWKEGFEKSSVSNVFKPIKLLIAGLTVDSIQGHKKTVIYEKTLNKVANTVADSISYDDMLAKLHNSNDMALHQLANKLGTIQEAQDENQINLIRQFFDQFDKNKNSFYKGLFNEQENTIGNAKANTTSVQDKIRLDWINNLKNIKANKIIKRVGAKLTLIDTVDRNTPQLALDFLEGLGLDVSNLTVYDLIADNAALVDIYNFINIIKKNTDGDISEILDRKKSDIKARVDSILNIIAKAEGEFLEVKESTAKGATVHGLTNSSNYTRTIDKLNAHELPEHIAKDPYCQDSVIVNIMKNPSKGETIRIEKIINSGIAKANANEGEDTAKLSFRDLLAYEFGNILEGIYSLLPTGDKKTPRAFAIKRKVGNNETNVSFVDLEQGTKTFVAVVDDITKQMFNYYQVDSKLKSRKEDILPKGEKKLGKVTLFDEIFAQFPNIDKEKSIRQFVESIIKENKQMFNEAGILNSNNTTLTPNVLKKLLGKERVSNDNDVNLLVAAFTGNTMISAIEQTKLFFGHPVFYKDFLDLFKRYAGEVAETNSVMNDENLLRYMDSREDLKRKDGKPRDGKFNTLVVEDIQAYNKELTKLHNGYEASEEADAYGIIFDDFFRDIQYLSNRWTSEQNEQWLKEYDGAQESEQLPAALKLLAFGTQEENLLRPFYLKFATFRVGKSLMEVIKEQKGEYPQLNQLLEKVAEQAKQGKYIDMVVFKSGNKVGTKVNNKGEAHPFYGEDGKISALNTEYLSELSLSDIGIQVENKAKESKVTTAGTQARAIEYANLYENGLPVTENVTINGKRTPIKDAVEESFEVQNLLTETFKQELANELELENSNDGYIFKDGGKKLLKALIEEQQKRDSPDNDIEGVIAEIKGLQNKGSIVMEKLVNKVKLQYILSSFITNKIVNQTRQGGQFVQFPSTGFETSPRTKIKVGKEDKWSVSDELKFYSKNGKRVMQVYLPYYFKDKVSNIIDITDNRLKEMYGFRIPTEQLNSIEVIEVAAFLPKSYGNSIIVPTGITTKVGSDFDFDKINMYFPNFHYKLNLKINHFKESAYYKSLDTTYKKTLEELSDDDFISLLEDLNQYSITSDKGFKGNLSESEYFKSLPENKQVLLKDLKDALVQYNKENKTSIEPVYIEYNEQNLNSPLRRKALENRLLEISIGLVSADFREAEHLSPNSIADVYDGKGKPSIVTTIREAKSKVSQDLLKDDYNDFKLSDLFRFKILSELKYKFWYGKDLIGIFALHNKNHVIAQIAGLKIKTLAPINFKGITGELVNDTTIYSLGKTKDLKGNLISSSTGQLVTLAADIAKNPDILPVLNLNGVTADAAMVLIRAGVPKDTVFYFLSQPVIKEYAEQIANSQGWIGSDLSKADIIKNLQLKYPVNDTVEFTDALLLSFDNKYQGQILNDFLNYVEMGNNLSEFQRAVAFDRVSFKTQEELDYAIYKYNKAMLNSTIVNKEQYVNTFIKGFVDSVIDTKDYWNNLFLSRRLPKFELLEQLKETIYESFGSTKDRMNSINALNNDLLNYIISNSFDGAAINDSYDTLLKGPNSIAKQLEAFKEANPKYSSLNNLVGEFNYKGTNNDHIKLFTKKLTSYEIDELADTLRDISNISTPQFNGQRFVTNLIKFTFIQNGFNPSTYNYINVIPSTTKKEETSFSQVLDSIISKFSPNDINIEEFIELFYLNNITNNTIVPTFKNKRNFDENHNLKVKATSGYANNQVLKFLDKEVNPITGEKESKWQVYRKSKSDSEYVYYRKVTPRSVENNLRNYRPLSEAYKAAFDVTGMAEENNIVEDVVKSLKASYDKMSATRKLEAKKELNVSNVEEFGALMEHTAKGALEKTPDLTKSELEELLRKNVNKCFKGGLK